MDAIKFPSVDRTHLIALVESYLSGGKHVSQSVCEKTCGLIRSAITKKSGRTQEEEQAYSLILYLSYGMKDMYKAFLSLHGGPSLPTQSALLEEQKKAVEKHEKQVASLRDRNAELDRQVASLRDRNAELDRQVASLRDRNGELEASRSIRAQEGAESSAKIASLEKQVEQLKKQIEGEERKNQAVLSSFTRATDVPTLQRIISGSSKKLAVSISEQIASLIPGNKKRRVSKKPLSPVEMELCETSSDSGSDSGSGSDSESEEVLGDFSDSERAMDSDEDKEGGDVSDESGDESVDVAPKNKKQKKATNRDKGAVHRKPVDGGAGPAPGKRGASAESDSRLNGHHRHPDGGSRNDRVFSAPSEKVKFVNKNHFESVAFDLCSQFSAFDLCAIESAASDYDAIRSQVPSRSRKAGGGAGGTASRKGVTFFPGEKGKSGNKASGGVPGKPSLKKVKQDDSRDEAAAEEESASFEDEECVFGFDE